MWAGNFSWLVALLGGKKSSLPCPLSLAGRGSCSLGPALLPDAPPHHKLPLTPDSLTCISFHRQASAFQTLLTSANEKILSEQDCQCPRGSDLGCPWWGKEVWGSPGV